METGDRASTIAAARRRTRRRHLLLGAAAMVAGWRAGAQEAPKSAHSGSSSPEGRGFRATGSTRRCRRLSWVEGHNLTVELRATREDLEERKTAAAELIAANPDVIVAAGVVDASPVHALTLTIRIVVIDGVDLVQAGLADSPARPGGNVTGMTTLGGELDGKRLELLRELVPTVGRNFGSGLRRKPEERSAHHRHRGSRGPLGTRRCG
jgi:putative tryptophan/tyrosine transport system substrate-binding protein